MAQIIATDLVVGYQTPLTPPLDFCIDKGEYWVIIGQNGSGKTTTLKTLLGLIKPYGGSLTMGGGLDKTKLGYLPQQTEVQRDFPASVYEVVLSGCLSKMGLRPFYNKTERQLARDNISKLGLSDLAKRPYRELSGGQQQRVLLARALCATDSLLVLDEPVAGLDPATTDEMYRLVKGLNQEGVTIVMISHDVDQALADCTHVLKLGKETFVGTVEQYEESRTKEEADHESV